MLIAVIFHVIRSKELNFIPASVYFFLPSELASSWGEEGVGWGGRWVMVRKAIYNCKTTEKKFIIASNSKAYYLFTIKTKINVYMHVPLTNSEFPICSYNVKNKYFLPYLLVSHSKVLNMQEKFLCIMGYMHASFY
jgi:hypothetical protein